MTHPTEDEIDAEHEYRRQYQEERLPSIGGVISLVILLLILLASIIFV